MTPWATPAVVVSLVVVQVVLYAWMTPVAAYIKYGNAYNKVNKKLPVNTSHNIIADTAVKCVFTCLSNSTCKALNYKNSTGSCELLNTTLCNGDSKDLINASGWNYYDLQDTNNMEEENPLYNDSACINYGICSKTCLRNASQRCRNTSQCSHLLVHGVIDCVRGRCKCAPLTDYYSTQRPVRPNDCRDIPCEK